MSEHFDCPTCSIPMPEQYDYECATCGMMASEHIGVTSMCKVLRAVSNREASLIVERDKLKRELDEAREQRDRLARELAAVTEERDTIRKLYNIAVEIAAKMHAAAVGETDDPNLTNPVQDILDLRRELDTAQKALSSVVEDHEKAVDRIDRWQNQARRERDENIKREERERSLERELTSARCQIAEAIEQRDRLAEAAKSVVDRWETPFWKQVEHTGVFIAALRKAVEEVKGGQP